MATNPPEDHVRARTIGICLIGTLLVIGLGSMPAHADRSRPAPRTAPDGTLGSWSALGSGFNDTVWTLEESPSGYLYAGGTFTASGATQTLGVARWTGSAWAQVGAGLDDSVGARTRLVSDLEFGNGLLYAVGNFSRSGAGPADDTGIAAFDGTTWNGVGGGITLVGQQDAVGLLVAGSNVYVAGTFTQVGSTPVSVNNIAAWNGTSWSDLGGGFPVSGQAARAIAMASTGDLIVGGKFTQAGPGVADDTRIARWNGTTWSPLGPSLVTSGSSQTYALAIASDDTVYAGGNFPSASNGTVIGKGLAQWNGTTWSRVGDGPGINSGAVRTIRLDERRGLLYIGGNFTTIDGVTANRVAVWDDGIGEWIPFMDDTVAGVSDSVESLVISGSHVFAGGLFTTAGQLPASRVAQWTWDAPEGVNALAGNWGDVVSLSGEGFIGVPPTGGVYFGGIPAPTYTRDDSTAFSGVVVPSGVYGTVPIEVDAVGGRATVGTFVGPNPPPTPASAPRDIAAVAGDASATVSWEAPESSGSYPVTNYLVTSSPGTRTCLTPTLECMVSGLMNGTSYTFTVQALTGAGWSPASAPSNAVTPSRAPERSILITGTRTKRLATVSGATTGFGMGAMLTPWIRLSSSGSFEQGRITALVSMDGTFTWERRMRPGRPLAVYFSGGGVRSNTLTLS